MKALTCGLFYVFLTSVDFVWYAIHDDVAIVIKISLFMLRSKVINV